MLRTLDPAPFIRMAEDYDVRDWLGFDDPDNISAINATISALVTNPDNFCFLTKGGDGGYILVKGAPGLYIAHTLSLPPARGRPMLRAMRDGFATMFTATDAIEIATMVPDGNYGAAKWAELAGFRPTYRREKFFRVTGAKVGGQFMTMSYADWVLKDAMCLSVGRLTHEQLNQARKEPAHDADEVHDRWVGATMGCCIEGNVEKGITLYNRWAVVAGYKPSHIITTHPPTVDIGDAIVQLVSGAMEVLHVRSTLPDTPN